MSEQSERGYDQFSRSCRPVGCEGCPLHHLATGYAGTDGTGKNGVLLLGEALGEGEAASGKPFQGDAGMMLNRILHRMGLKRNDFLISNTVRCRPPNNFLEGAPYELAAIEHCDQYLKATLAANPQIKVIVPMGNVAMWKLLGHRGIKNFHGTVHHTTRYRELGHWVVPTLHPSGIMRAAGVWKEFPTAIFDITRALEVVKNGWYKSPVEYILFPQPPDFERFIEGYEQALEHDPEFLLAADIETNYSSELDEEELLEKDLSYEVIRISFSYKINEGITLPFTRAFIPLVMRLLGG